MYISQAWKHLIQRKQLTDWMNNAKQEKHETGTTDFVHLYRSICDSPSIFQSGNKAPHKY